ncbi:MAG: amidohydrolase family protein [Nitriliruptorales bacterium]|nr:amidohydrolase family protein [Nitriliruptorales bacterium]
MDAHHHLWDPDRRAYPWLSPEELAPIRRRYDVEQLRELATSSGVEGTVLVQTVGDLDETREFLAVAADSAGFVRGVVGWAELTAPDLASQLDDLRAGRGGNRLVGIRHQAQDEPDPAWLSRADVIRGLRTVAAAGLAYDILVLPHQLFAAIDATTLVPEGRFVLDHAAKPPIRSGALEPWASQIRALAAQPHVFCKLSGLVTEADWRRWRPADLRPYAETVLDAFGPQRVMAGSDWPVCELAADYTQVWETTKILLSGLTRAEESDVLAGTATSAYHLP